MIWRSRPYRGQRVVSDRPLPVQDGPPLPPSRYAPGGPIPGIPWLEVTPLPWAQWWQRRCRARTEPGRFYWGRCELRAGHAPEIDHALGRGMETPRWSTRWTA